jgi:cytochrome P450
MTAVPEINVTEPEALLDPVATYGWARESSPLARFVVPGLAPMWVVTRHETARAMLSDPRFELNSDSFMTPRDIPDHCRPYLRSMSEQDGPEHLRLRRLVAPAFTPRRAAEFRPRLEAIVDALLDELQAHAENGVVDLLAHFARPLPIEVICELVGIDVPDRPRWREYGAAIAAGHGEGFLKAIPGIIDDSLVAVGHRRDQPGEDVVSHLLHAQAEDGDRLDGTELVTLVWHLVLAGQTPANLIANSVETLFAHPAQLAALRDDPALMPNAVEELMRWCSPQLLTTPRYAREDVVLDGVPIAKGEAVVASILSANRDPRAFADPDHFDALRPVGPAAQLGFSHGPHFCLGASLARVETEVALSGLLKRFPALALAVPPAELVRAPDPGTWRLAALPVTLVS